MVNKSLGKSKKIEKYYGHEFVDFEPLDESKSNIYLEINVLSELISKPFDELAFSLLSALKPSALKVFRESDRGIYFYELKLWGVTIKVDDDNNIISIMQLVKVPAVGDIDNEICHSLAMRYGMNSDQVKWFSEGEVNAYAVGDNGFSYKEMKDGSIVKFPEA